MNKSLGFLMFRILGMVLLFLIGSPTCFKTLYWSIKTIYFTAFMAMAEKIITYALGEHSVQDGRTSSEM